LSYEPITELNRLSWIEAKGVRECGSTNLSSCSTDDAIAVQDPECRVVTLRLPVVYIDPTTKSGLGHQHGKSDLPRRGKVVDDIIEFETSAESMPGRSA
jgi:hypothetical protein